MVKLSLTRGPRLFNEKITEFSINGTGETGHLHAKEWCWVFTLCHIKNNSKCIKNLNIRPKIVKLLEESIGQNLPNIDFGNGLLAMSSKACTTEDRQNGLHDFFLILHQRNSRKKKKS